MTDPTPSGAITRFDWAQFGLAGLVILALFSGFYSFSKQHQEERSEWLATSEKQRIEFQAERKEWKLSAEKRDEKIEQVIKELTQVIREQQPR